MMTYREALRTAAPMIIANAVLPLAGVVDTAVIGATGDSAALGGVALGVVVFNVLYSSFYFLRMGSSGLAAQAEGAGDGVALQRILLRAVGLALVLGGLIWVASGGLAALGFAALQGSPEVEAAGLRYFWARVAGAPGALVLSAVSGWLIGRGQTRTVLVLSALWSATNGLLDVLLVSGGGLGVWGVGAATAAADILGALVALGVAARQLQQAGGRRVPWSALLPWGGAEAGGFLRMNLDMMLRSWSLLLGFAWFAAVGARQGDAVLAGNHVLLQVVSVWAFVLDAFAFTAEVAVGRAAGQGAVAELRRGIRVTSALALGAGATFVGLTLLVGPWLLPRWLQDAQAAQVALRYLPYCAVVPLLGVPAWQLDGIFIGATRAADMRRAALLAVAIYIVADRVLTPWLGVDGMWLAFLLYYVARAGALAVAYPRLERAVALTGRSLPAGSAPG